MRKRKKEKKGSISKLWAGIPRISHSIYNTLNSLSEEAGKCINSAVTRFSDDLPGTKPTKHTAGQLQDAIWPDRMAIAGKGAADRESWRALWATIYGKLLCSLSLTLVLHAPRLCSQQFRTDYQENLISRNLKAAWVAGKIGRILGVFVLGSLLSSATTIDFHTS